MRLWDIGEVFSEKRVRDSNNDRTSLGDTTQVE
jgi:hypothetical protein